MAKIDGRKIESFYSGELNSPHVRRSYFFTIEYCRRYVIAQNLLTRLQAYEDAILHADAIFFKFNVRIRIRENEKCKHDKSALLEDQGARMTTIV